MLKGIEQERWPDGATWKIYTFTNVNVYIFCPKVNTPLATYLLFLTVRPTIPIFPCMVLLYTLTLFLYIAGAFLAFGWDHARRTRRQEEWGFYLLLLASCAALVIGSGLR